VSEPCRKKSFQKLKNWPRSEKGKKKKLKLKKKQCIGQVGFKKRETKDHRQEGAAK